MSESVTGGVISDANNKNDAVMQQQKLFTY